MPVLLLAVARYPPLTRFRFVQTRPVAEYTYAFVRREVMVCSNVVAVTRESKGLPR